MKNNRVLFTSLLFFVGLFVACSSNNLAKSSSEKADTISTETIYEVYQNGSFTEQTLDQEPIPNGGEKNFAITMYRKMKYPAQAREKGIQGTVLITVIINEFGQLENANLKKGIGHGCDEEALAAINRGCQLGFEPAKKDNNAVKVKYDIPVKFNLH